MKTVKFKLREKNMSDIKIEVKEAIENFKIGKTSNLSNKQLLTWLSCFLTTIESQPKMWDCPDCGFSFDAIHVDESGGGYSCPLCAELRLEKSVKEKDALIESQKEEIEALHDALEMLPTKDIEIHERTQFKIKETVQKLVIASLKEEIERLRQSLKDIIECSDIETAVQEIAKNSLLQEGKK